MKWTEYIVTGLLLGALVVFAATAKTAGAYGAVPWYAWFLLLGMVVVLGLSRAALDTSKTRWSLSRGLSGPNTNEAVPSPLTPSSPEMDANGPSFPHPVINVETCIGCHACVEACPHDVLAMLNGKAIAVSIEQCMEDTSCQVECPTVPKSCVVVNSTKEIPARKVPKRDAKYMTNVPGIYLIGDVSGVPLIKNAINEGGAVVDFVMEDLKVVGKAAAGEYDVAIVGLGPAGLSAAVIAQERGLRYVALDQERVLATIQQTYQAGKYVFFNPVDKPAKGGIRLEGQGAVKEAMIDSWLTTARACGVAINENEGCKSITQEDNVFTVATEKEASRQTIKYRARRVILAIGNRGTPMKLNVPGEDLTVRVTPVAAFLPDHCSKCGKARVEENKFCQECGALYVPMSPETRNDDKVKYKLTDPDQYQDKDVIVVGAGNSAIEAAIDLAAFRSADGTRITGWRDNRVSLVVRSDFKSDLKLGNKMLVYDCIDAMKIKAYFGATIKEIRAEEVVLMGARERDPRTARELARIRNDYVFALIGGEKPTKFLESLGVQIG